MVQYATFDRLKTGQAQERDLWSTSWQIIHHHGGWFEYAAGALYKQAELQPRSGYTFLKLDFNATNDLWMSLTLQPPHLWCRRWWIHSSSQRLPEVYRLIGRRWHVSGFGLISIHWSFQFITTMSKHISIILIPLVCWIQQCKPIEMICVQEGHSRSGPIAFQRFTANSNVHLCLVETTPIKHSSRAVQKAFRKSFILMGTSFGKNPASAVVCRIPGFF